MRAWSAAPITLALGAGLVAWTGGPPPDAPVADAARQGDLAAVQELLSAGADVNLAHGDGMTGLHWAAGADAVEMVTLLLDHGADVHAVTRIGAHTPLHVAASAGAAAALGHMLEAGADPGARTTTGATALHFAAASGSGAAIEALVAHGADPDARETRWGQTPLMFAAPKGRVDAVVALLAAGADPGLTAHVIDIPERSVRDRAEQRARAERMAAASEPAASERPTGRDAAARAESREEAERRGGEPIPLNYADLVGTHGGLGALHLAAREGQAAVIDALLDGGADLDQPSAGDASTPLLIATLNGYFDLALELLERGADPRRASSAGATPLYAALNMHWAPKARHPQPTVYMQQRVGYLELMEAFIQAGADVNARLERTLWYTTYNRDLLGVDRTGATPFWRAAYALDLDAMSVLLEHGADPTLGTIKVPERRRRDGDGEDHSGLPPVPIGGPAVLPIHAASGVGYGQGFAGNSHRHVPDGWVAAVRFLVEELGADVNARDHNGYTPAHHAAARGDNDLIRYLVDRGADVTAVARNGRTTVDMANGPVQRVQPYPETIALLESLGAVNNHNCVSC